MNCRHCHMPLTNVFLDLGFAPPSNAYLTERDLHAPETWFPLKLYVCENCWLVQTEDYASADALFSKDYAYFSSTSTTWLEHARGYAEEMRQRLGLTQDSFVIEVASNDGYLLKNFVAAGIPAWESSLPTVPPLRPRPWVFRSCANSSAKAWVVNSPVKPGRPT
jgi:hypothetical protein